MSRELPCLWAHIKPHFDLTSIDTCSWEEDNQHACPRSTLEEEMTVMWNQREIGDSIELLENELEQMILVWKGLSDETKWGLVNMTCSGTVRSAGGQDYLTMKINIGCATGEFSLEEQPRKCYKIHHDSSYWKRDNIGPLLGIQNLYSYLLVCFMINCIFFPTPIMLMLVGILVLLIYQTFVSAH